MTDSLYFMIAGGYGAFLFVTFLIAIAHNRNPNDYGNLLGPFLLSGIGAFFGGAFWPISVTMSLGYASYKFARYNANKPQ